ncbi:dNMP kinase [Streptomyces phage Shaeky]|uniref:DNMP kinase n=1 Tax=Streptomyces phage Shaeky TaxID=2767586 RepID=A0A873WHT8_9CAUD|nr:dNMP kinase [Streptomyces phage Shaeky]
MRDVALIGRARSGKDSVGARLVSRYGYKRLAFADPLKDMVLEINPWVPTTPGVVVRLHRLIQDVGWDYAKETYPEVRRILQHTGQSVRRQDPNYWVRVMRDTIDHTTGRLVITDVRYPNEADFLAGYGFRLVRINRPALGDPDPNAHISETALDDYPVPVTILNNGTLEDLHAHADSIAQ